MRICWVQTVCFSIYSLQIITVPPTNGTITTTGTIKTSNYTTPTNTSAISPATTSTTASASKPTTVSDTGEISTPRKCVDDNGDWILGSTVGTSVPVLIIVVLSVVAVVFFRKW